MVDTVALKAQLKALQAELERKQLEEEIVKLRKELSAKGSITVDLGADEEILEEEYYEEIYEEEYEEEEIIEEDEPVSTTAARAVTFVAAAGPDRQSVQAPQKSDQKPTAIARNGPAASKISKFKNAFKMRRPAQPTDASSQTKQPTVVHVPETAPLHDELRILEEKLQRKQLEEELKALEVKAAAMGIDDIPTRTKSSAQPIMKKKVSPPKKSPVAKPAAGPFTQRVIPNIEASPAGQETPMELLMGPKMYKNGKLVATTTRAACEGQELVLLFFAASWNRQCKPFFPKLLDFYKLVSNAHKAECIYVSTDRNLNEFKEAFSNMPYVAMPTGTADYKNRIAKELKILEVPFLVVLDVATAHVITTNGVDLVDRLERGNWDQASALVEEWKSSTPVPLEQVQLDTRLVNGTMERGILYWHN